MGEWPWSSSKMKMNSRQTYWLDWVHHVIQSQPLFFVCFHFMDTDASVVIFLIHSEMILKDQKCQSMRQIAVCEVIFRQNCRMKTFNQSLLKQITNCQKFLEQNIVGCCSLHRTSLDWKRAKIAIWTHSYWNINLTFVESTKWHMLLRTTACLKHLPVIKKMVLCFNFQSLPCQTRTKKVQLVLFYCEMWNNFSAKPIIAFLASRSQSSFLCTTVLDVHIIVLLFAIQFWSDRLEFTNRAKSADSFGKIKIVFYRYTGWMSYISISALKFSRDNFQTFISSFLVN